MIKYDDVIETIATYVDTYQIQSPEAYTIARLCLIDALSCALLALNFPACTQLLGPLIPGADVANGCRIPGTLYVLDPVQAAFQTGLLIRWLDFNDTWLGREWGHPSDNLGGLLPICEWKKLTLQDLLTGMIKAYEIQGILALDNSYNSVGMDHVTFVKIATAAVVTKLIGGNYVQICAALSQAFIDVGPLRAYRHAPNTGSRKSWASGDATARGVQLALWTLRGEMGYPTALTAPTWGLYDAVFQGKPLTFQRPLSSYVIENILFKVSFPAEFHAQTAVEAAFVLHPEVVTRLDEIDRIEVDTHAAALQIIDKQGPLKNPADRDHCLQYMIAIGLLHGTLQASDYEDDAAKDPRINLLRQKMVLKENSQYSLDYHDPSKRSIANALTVFFEDGTHLGPIAVEYPLGHRERRAEAFPLLEAKWLSNFASRSTPLRAELILNELRSAAPITPIARLLDFITPS